MRILVVGAGATGGYFGGRLLEAGRDVTFLVRAPRASQIAQHGLVIKSPDGNATLRDVKTVQAETLSETYDLILLSCKAYDLEGAMASFAPAVGPETVILPLLNGLRHLDVLDQAFGRGRVLGGRCAIAATLDAERAIVHLNAHPGITYGVRESTAPSKIEAITAALQTGRFEAKASADIMLEMWEKWVFLATLACSTSLFRAAIGDINAAPEGEKRIAELFEECRAVALANGYTPSVAFVANAQKMLLAAGSTLTASMMRDVENNSRIEADHIVGDLILRAAAAGMNDRQTSMLRIAYTHLKAYEARRARTAAA
jgi:2-dehydropantoate 2-reductase